jgi:HPP family
MALVTTNFRNPSIFSGGAALKYRSDLLWATLGEGGLVLAVAVIGWATKEPLIFASLGPTAYELVEQPQVRSARAYNIVVGHMIGLGAGFLALYLLHAWSAPNVLAAGFVSTQRLWATTLAAALTTFFTLVMKAGQPAALATTLLVSLGAMQTHHAAFAIAAGVLIITVIGEPVRRFRLKHIQLRKVVSTN